MRPEHTCGACAFEAGTREVHGSWGSAGTLLLLLPDASPWDLGDGCLPLPPYPLTALSLLPTLWWGWFPFSPSSSSPNPWLSSSALAQASLLSPSQHFPEVVPQESLGLFRLLHSTLPSSSGPFLSHPLGHLHLDPRVMSRIHLHLLPLVSTPSPDGSTPHCAASSPALSPCPIISQA